MLGITFIFLLTVIKVSHGFSDIGKWDLPLNGDTCGFSISKSLFKDTKLILVLHCDVKTPTNITVEYKWLATECSPDYFHYYDQTIVTCKTDKNQANRTTIEHATVKQTHTCHSKESIFFDEVSKTSTDGHAATDSNIAQSKISPVLIVEEEGVYTLHMLIHSNVEFNATMHVEMVAPSGYLSAAIYPLLPFFSCMCAVYTILCALWLVACALRWRDLLRIQYWIGAVALLGMLEAAVCCGLYSHINRTGLFNLEAYLFVEWISVVKRALARMLVIIVSLGFGIVKPRLGNALQRVVGTGALWGVLAGVEAYLRLAHTPGPGGAGGGARGNTALLLADAPIAALDSAICWWVFVSLSHTQRTLQLRRNTVKMSLYKHFTNTLIFAVISSVAFMIYSIKSYRVHACITEWKDIWLDVGYWHVQFAGVLAAIMALWRPTNNNQRYAFTPLLDHADDDDEEEEHFVNDAFGVKMRGSVNAGDSEKVRENSAQPDPSSNSLDSDLRWVEENIPSSSLPLLDSDEEIINTKFEVSKMQ